MNGTPPMNALGLPPRVASPYALNWGSVFNALGSAKPQQNPPRDPNSPYDQEIAPLGQLGSGYDGLMDMFTRLWR